MTKLTRISNGAEEFLWEEQWLEKDKLMETISGYIIAEFEDGEINEELIVDLNKSLKKTIESYGFFNLKDFKNSKEQNLLHLCCTKSDNVEIIEFIQNLLEISEEEEKKLQDIYGNSSKDLESIHNFCTVCSEYVVDDAQLARVNRYFQPEFVNKKDGDGDSVLKAIILNVNQNSTEDSLARVQYLINLLITNGLKTDDCQEERGLIAKINGNKQKGFRLSLEIKEIDLALLNRTSNLGSQNFEILDEAYANNNNNHAGLVKLIFDQLIIINPSEYGDSYEAILDALLSENFYTNDYLQNLLDLAEKKDSYPELINYLQGKVAQVRSSAQPNLDDAIILTPPSEPEDDSQNERETRKRRTPETSQLPTLNIANLLGNFNTNDYEKFKTKLSENPEITSQKDENGFSLLDYLLVFCCDNPGSVKFIKYMLNENPSAIKQGKSEFYFQANKESFLKIGGDLVQRIEDLLKPPSTAPQISRVPEVPKFGNVPKKPKPDTDRLKQNSADRGRENQL